MRKITKVLALGAAVAVAGTVGWQAFAQTPMGWGPHGMGMGMGPGMMMGGMMGWRGPMAGRPAEPSALLAALKTELGITAQQEPAWNAYAKVLEDTAESMRAQHQGIDRGAVHAMSDQDRLGFMTQMLAQRQMAFEAVKTAAETLLAALDDPQKAKAKDILPGLAEYGPGMMRHAGRGQYGAPQRGPMRW